MPENLSLIGKNYKEYHDTPLPLFILSLESTHESKIVFEYDSLSFLPVQLVTNENGCL